MKTNLVKILAMSTMLLTLGACGTKKKDEPQPEPGPQPETPVELTLGQLTNLVDGNWEHVGKLATVKDLAVMGAYGNGTKLTVGAPYEEGGSFVGGAEVTLKEAYTFSEATKGLGAKVTITGRVADENGHVSLKDAQIDAISEREYVNGKRKEGTGADLGIWSLNNPHRKYYNMLGRDDSAATWEFEDFVLATKPATYDGSQELVFYVTFPGENPFVDDEYNLDKIAVVVPDGIDTKFHKPFNDFFASLKVGDTISGYFNTFYSDSEMCILMNPQWFFWDDVFAKEQGEKVIKTYAEATEKFADRYTVPMPALTENERVYRYDVNDLWATPISDLSGDLSFVADELKADGGLIVIDMMTTYGNAETLLESVTNQFVAKGYAKSTGSNKTFLRLTSGERSISDVALYVAQDEDYHYCVEMLYVGKRVATEIQYDTFADALAAYNNKIGATSALVGLPATPAETGVELSWVNKDTFTGAVTYQFNLQFGLGAFADDAAWMQYEEDYAELLAAQGWDVKGEYLCGNYWIEGFLNTTTNEFAFFNELEDDNEHIIGLQLFILKVTDAKYFYGMSDSFVWSDESAIRYIAAAWGYIMEDTYVPSQGQGYYGFSMGAFYSQYKDILVEYAGDAIPSAANLKGSQAAQGYTHYIYYLNENNAANTVVIQLSVGDDIPDSAGDYFRMQVMTYYAS